MECELRGSTVNYDVHGDGRPLLILPGWAASARYSAHFKENLFGGLDGWRRIYVDPPGHGRSPAAPGISNMDGLLGALVSFVDAVLPGERFVLAGYSAGAYLARGMLYLRPEQVDGLFMCAPVIVADDDEREVPPHVVVAEEPGFDLGIRPELEGLMAVAAVRTQTTLESFTDTAALPSGVDGDPEFRSRIRNSPHNYAFSFDVDDLEEPFPRPVLIVAGRQDSVVGYSDAWKIMEKFPRATFVVLDRAGHLLEEKERPNRALVREWLDRVEETERYAVH
jgi:pimeloyl-ACP methyl ester carboxylesterase